MASNSLAEVIGIRRPGLEAATILPLGLTMILFLGPIAMLVTNDRFRWLIHPSYWTHCFKDWIWWRNHVVAPFTEEFAFRYVFSTGYNYNRTFTPSTTMLCSRAGERSIVAPCMQCA